jgi:hypothetical protein
LPHEEADRPVVTHSVKWLRSFYEAHSKLHAEVVAAPSIEAFLDKVLPPVDCKWHDKIMYAFVYSGRGELKWKHYMWVTAEQDVLVKNFIQNHPNFVIYLGRTIAGDAEEVMIWSKSFKWETSDPRIMQDHNPSDCWLLEGLFKTIKREENEKNGILNDDNDDDC